MTSSEQLCRPVERGFVSSLAPFSHALVNQAVTVITVPNFLQDKLILTKQSSINSQIFVYLNFLNENSSFRAQKAFYLFIFSQMSNLCQ